MYACLYRPPRGNGTSASSARPASPALLELAADFSPRFERYTDDLVVVDVGGLERLLGPAQTIGEELQRAAAARTLRAHVAIARTQIAALVLAHARPGLTVAASGSEAAMLAPIAMGVLQNIDVAAIAAGPFAAVPPFPLDLFARWGLRTLGDVAALPAADLVARTGRTAATWQALARGEDVRPLMPTVADERFDASLELEWPIDGLEPLSFVLTRLLEPLSTRLERRDRGAAVLHVTLRLTTREATGTARDVYARRLELPTPMRDVRALRTLALLDLESHPPGAPVDAVTIVIEPTPARIVQHRLFTRTVPTPEQISTLLARLGALMGQDRIGAPAGVDTYRPGAFATAPFGTQHDGQARAAAGDAAPPVPPLNQALRRCREPVPARVVVAAGRPVRVTTDRRGFTGGAVLECAGPWRTSGNWWSEGAGRVDRPGAEPPWNRDEWDVSLSDGGVYRIFQDRETEGWFVDAIVD